MHRSLARKVVGWTIGLSVILMLVAAIIGSLLMRYLVGFIGAAIIMSVSLPFANCPHCGSFMRANFLWTHYCPHCGEYLDD